MNKQIIPAILSNDIERLEKMLDTISAAVDWVQIDIMDGVFVPEVSVRLMDLVNLKTDINLEIHLMVKDPINYIQLCRNAGVKRFIFHIESAVDIENILSETSKYNFDVGIALKPETPVSFIEPYFKKIDLVLLLGVEPGAQGRSFQLETLNKIRKIKSLAPELTLEVDGGINKDNIQLVAEAGADYLVSGSGIFSQGDYIQAIRELQDLIF